MSNRKVFVNKKRKKRRKSGPIFRLPYPKKRFVMFKFADHFNLNPGTTTYEGVQFQANSIFDPAGTSGVAQPRYFDQLVVSNLYTLYQVHSIGYRVEFINKSTTSDALVSVLFRKDATSLPAGNSAHWEDKELQYSYVKTLLPLGQSNSRCVIKGRMDCAKILATSKFSYLSDRSSYQALFNANPAAIMFMNVGASDDPNGSAGADVDVYVTLYMNAELSELAHTVAQS